MRFNVFKGTGSRRMADRLREANNTIKRQAEHLERLRERRDQLVDDNVHLQDENRAIPRLRRERQELAQMAAAANARVEQLTTTCEELRRTMAVRERQRLHERINDTTETQPIPKVRLSVGGTLDPTAVGLGSMPQEWQGK